MLELLFQGLLQWLYNLSLEMVEYMANSLLGVFSMNLGYFESVAPVSTEILNILMAVGWALLLGNLVFQASKSMVSGIGVEGEDPTLLFLRTFLFGFLLLASRQICDIGLGLTSAVIALLQVPDAVTFHLPEETAFPIAASWLLVVIVGVVIMWQVLELFLEIGERYVVMAILTLSAPLAFATGGSKSTADIFKGWARMFGSMCLIMVFNVIFLKLLLSAMSYMPVGLDTFPWMLVIVGIARVARKIDGIITRIGLNPALTGDGLGRGLPGMFTFAVLKSIGSTVGKTIGAQGGHRGAAGTGSRRGGNPGGAANRFAPGGGAQTGAAAGASRAGTTATAPPTGTAGKSGAAGAAGTASTAHQERQDGTSSGMAGNAATVENPTRPQDGGTRRSAAPHPAGFVRSSQSPGAAGIRGAAFHTTQSSTANAPGRAGTEAPASPTGAAGKSGISNVVGTGKASQSAGTMRPGRQPSPAPQQSDKAGKPAGSGGQTGTRFTAVPPTATQASSAGTTKNQSRTTERTSTQSNTTQSNTTKTSATQSGTTRTTQTIRSGAPSVASRATQSTPSGADSARPATAQTAVSGEARQQRRTTSVAPEGQHAAQSRPAGQERAVSSAAPAGQRPERPLSATVGSGRRPAQEQIPQNKPTRPAGQGVSPAKVSRPVPGGKIGTAPKAQSQRRAKGGNENGR